MANDKFELLQSTYIEDTEGSQNAQLKALRAKARGYRDAHNILIKKFWDIEQIISWLHDEQDKVLLISEKEAISKQIEEADYINKTKDVLEKIRALEIALDGHSDIGSTYK